MYNYDYIKQEYEKRNLIALIAEYKRLDMFVEYVVDVLDDQPDDDTNDRYQLVQEVICQNLLKEYDKHSSAFLDFEYWKDIGLPSNWSSAG